jgi:hypothetical protein
MSKWIKVISRNKTAKTEWFQTLSDIWRQLSVEEEDKLPQQPWCDTVHISPSFSGALAFQWITSSVQIGLTWCVQIAQIIQMSSDDFLASGTVHEWELTEDMWSNEKSKSQWHNSMSQGKPRCNGGPVLLIFLTSLSSAWKLLLASYVGASLVFFPKLWCFKEDFPQKAVQWPSSLLLS